ncbi:TonB-dependent receptor [Microbulbifer spongiae]|uniref:TonB-dependent receptor n=1 Tax=Microbulbifer spongiae TaxID=2944933 RepID=A0ABY9EGF2_9GAMM|nr:TonB-dependent receptor [Microbulbifer sp. MI-G]WKD49881.1 TonB-dependent receptor [Microbulbifer sp. MI-G]
MKILSSSIRNLTGGRSRLLHSSLAVLALSGVVGTLHAQETALEEVVVTGIRASITESVNAKRSANAIVDAITAEDLGKFPDKNVADSLSRITGVSVTRGFGEGEKIAVRGTSPNQNRTLLNGAAVASADWFILDNPSRAFNYTLLPSTIVSALEVYKTPQASIQEGSLGGTVMLHTRRPLDMAQNTGALQVQGQYSETSEEWDPSISALYSWKNDAENLGFNISLTRQDRTLLREGTEVLGFENQDFGRGALWVPRALGDAYFEQARERETVLFTGQWRPSDNGQFTLTYLDSGLDADNSNYNRYEWLNGNNGGTIDPATAVVTGSGVIAGEVANSFAEYYVIDRVSYSETGSLDLHYEHNFEQLTLHARLGHTEAEGGTARDRHYGWGASLDRTEFNGLSHTPYLNGQVESDAQLGARGLGWMQENARVMDDDENYASIDIDFALDAGVFNSLKSGLLYRDHNKGQMMTLTRFHWLSDAMHADGTTTYGEGDTTGWNRWLYGNLDAGLLGNYTRNASGAPYPLMDISAAQSAIFPAEAYENAVTVLNLPENWNVEEEILAAYGQADFEGEGFRGNLGLRMVQTRVGSSGYNLQGDPLAAAIDMVGGYDLLVALVDPATEEFNVRRETLEHDYTEILPSANVAFDIAENQVLRLSAARVMARPDYITIANQESANLDTQVGRRGNPQLEPETANQFDLAWEWYFTEGAVLAATYFQKDIANSVINSTSVDFRFDERLGEDIPVLFIQPVNGKGAKVSGIELSYQQNFGNFGVIANYTYTDANSRDTRDPVNNPGSGLIPGQSENMANLTGFYENDWISARLAYNFRTQWYDGLSEFGSEAYIDDYGQWDASITVSPWENWDFVLEAINLTGEELAYYHIDQEREARRYDNGTRVLLGANYHF